MGALHEISTQDGEKIYGTKEAMEDSKKMNNRTQASKGMNETYKTS